MTRAKKITKVEAAPVGIAPNKKTTAESSESSEETFVREYWTGDSRDGVLVNGDGYHYYRMTKSGKILEAYEFYETEDGREFANPLPEMLNVHWKNDLGFEDFEALDAIREFDFERIKEISQGISSS
jgi:hypothetical protein